MNAAQFNSNPVAPRLRWQTVILLAIAFWLSGSLLLDFVVMPMLSVAGMTAQPGFAAAGYGLFWFFNRLEALGAAVILTGLWSLRQIQDSLHRKGWLSLAIASGLLAIALTDTYCLSPQMSALGLSLNWFETTPEFPSAMIWMHWAYWSLDALKLLGLVGLLGLCCRDRV